MRTSLSNIVSGAVFLVVSILYFAGTFTFVEISRFSKEAKFLPRVYAVFLFCAALWILVKGIRDWTRERSAAKTAAAGAAEVAETHRPNYFKVVMTLILLAVYACMFHRLGFISAAVIYLVAHMAVLAGSVKGRLPTIIGVSVATALCLYYLFAHIFQIAFPYGLLF